MGKQPLPVNPLSLSPLESIPDIPQWTRPSQVVMTRPPSPAMSIYPTFDLPPTQPATPIPWSIHRQEYSSLEQLTEHPLEDPDSPMEDALPLEPEPFIPYEPDTPGGNTHALSPDESPVAPWREYHDDPPPPVSCKHSLSPTSPLSAPIHQRTSREGSYQLITPAALSPIASTSPQNQGYQSTSPEGSADNPSSMQSSTDDADSDMALNWVTINTDYCKG